MNIGALLAANEEYKPIYYNGIAIAYKEKVSCTFYQWKVSNIKNNKFTTSEFLLNRKPNYWFRNYLIDFSSINYEE